MYSSSVLAGTCRATFLTALFGLAGAGWAAEFNVTRTNLQERWITNVIDVRMPVNRFVDVYKTNLVEQWHTNVVAVYRTNHLSATVTNAVDVTAVHTNLVTAWRTNWNTLTLTNFETVVVLKTNWVTQPVTNVVDLNWRADPRRQRPQPPVAAEPPPAAEIRMETLSSSAAANLAEPIVLEAAKTVRSGANNRVEVKLKVKPAANTADAPLEVQQWRVESADGSILSFGQGQEFKRELPVGQYKVEVKGRRSASGPALTGRGTLTVTASDALIQQRPVASL